MGFVELADHRPLAQASISSANRASFVPDKRPSLTIINQLLKFPGRHGALLLQDVGGNIANAHHRFCSVLLSAGKCGARNRTGKDTALMGPGQPDRRRERQVASRAVVPAQPPTTNTSGRATTADCDAGSRRQPTVAADLQRLHLRDGNRSRARPRRHRLYRAVPGEVLAQLGHLPGPRHAQLVEVDAELAGERALAQVGAGEQQGCRRPGGRARSAAPAGSPGSSCRTPAVRTGWRWRGRRSTGAARAGIMN